MTDLDGVLEGFVDTDTDKPLDFNSKEFANISSFREIADSCTLVSPLIHYTMLTHPDFLGVCSGSVQAPVGIVRLEHPITLNAVSNTFWMHHVLVYNNRDWPGVVDQLLSTRIVIREDSYFGGFTLRTLKIPDVKSKAGAYDCQLIELYSNQGSVYGQQAGRNTFTVKFAPAHDYWTAAAEAYFKDEPIMTEYVYVSKEELANGYFMSYAGSKLYAADKHPYVQSCLDMASNKTIQPGGKMYNYHQWRASE